MSNHNSCLYQQIQKVLWQVVQNLTQFVWRGRTVVSSSLFNQNSLGMGFPSGTSGKEPVCQSGRLKRREFGPWVQRIPWRRARQSTPVFLPGERHGQRRLDRLQAIELHRVRHDWSDLTHRTSLLHLFILYCLLFFFSFNKEYTHSYTVCTFLLLNKIQTPNTLTVWYEQLEMCELCLTVF